MAAHPHQQFFQHVQVKPVAQVELSNQRNKAVRGDDLAIAFQPGEDFKVPFSARVVNWLGVKVKTADIKGAFYAGQH